jgi:hypothetical protein
MVQTINQSQFIDAFRAMGRKDQFSYNALVALFEWLEKNDENYDLDVIELCCEFTEYSDLEEFNAAYNDDNPEYNFDIDEIEARTTLIPIGKGSSFIVNNF